MEHKTIPVRNIALTGGGTAGHVLPHFALFEEGAGELAQAFKENRCDIYYFGSHNGMEKELVGKSTNWKYQPIKVGKLRRYFSWQNFTDPFLIILGFFQAVYYLNKYKISLVFSKGGFVGVPVVWAAWISGIPIVIHESDVTPALATKLTSPMAHKVLVAFEETKYLLPSFARSRCLVVGLPLRKSLFSASKSEGISFFKLNPDLKTLLIYGGSLGAEGLNQKIKLLLPQITKNWNVIHVVGKGKTFETGGLQNYHQYEYLSSEMKLGYAVADAAIARAGASSIFELAAARIPMILVPLGSAQSRGDQIVNAKLFEKNGWAKVLMQEEIYEGTMLPLLDNNSIVTLKQSLESAPGIDSSEKVAHILASLLFHA